MKKRALSDEVLTVIEKAGNDQQLGRQLLLVLGKIQRRESLRIDEFQGIQEILKLEALEPQVSKSVPPSSSSK